MSSSHGDQLGQPMGVESQNEEEQERQNLDP